MRTSLFEESLTRCLRALGFSSEDIESTTQKPKTGQRKRGERTGGRDSASRSGREGGRGWSGGHWTGQWNVGSGASSSWWRR